MAATKTKQIHREDTPETKVGGSIPTQVNSVAKDTVKSFWDEFLLGGAKSVPDQIMGDILGFSKGEESNKAKMGGDLQEGQIVELKKKERKAEHKARHQEVYAREILQTEKAPSMETAIISRKIDEILIELKNLANATTEMQVLHKEIASETRPVDPGTYHLNFYEWMLIVIRSARQKMEESSSWLAMFASKKRQQKYGAMAKKHGTSFTLSSERSSVTQTG